MKTIGKISKFLTTGALPAGLTINFNACTEQSPISSTAETQVKKREIEILRYQDTSKTTLKKIVSAAEMVTIQNGGQLHLEMVNGNGCSIQINLDVAAGSISQDAMLSMSLDDELLIVRFNIPADVTFSQEPDLTISAQGLNLDNFDIADLSVYQEDNGQWQAMPNGSVSSSGGLIIGRSGLGGIATLNGRYAIGGE